MGICLVVDEPEAEKIKVLFRKQEFYIFCFCFYKTFFGDKQRKKTIRATDCILI